MSSLRFTQISIILHRSLLISYQWNFGDGTPPVIETNRITTHAYGAKGVYNVTLSAIDNKRETQKVSQKITVTTETDLMWFDYETGSICWRANLTSYSIFRVDLDGNHSTAAFGGKGGWTPEYGEFAYLGVVVSGGWFEQYGYAFRIGERKIENSSAHIHTTYSGRETEWFYFWVPKTTPPTDWIVCLQGSDGVEPIPVTKPFWYSRDRGETWKAYDPWTPAVTSFTVWPNPFSPNMDGRKDTTTITASFNTIVNWKLQIRTATGLIVRTWTGTGRTLTINWNGKNSTGAIVPDGIYKLRLSGSNLSDTPFKTQWKTATVDTTPPLYKAVSVSPTSFNPSLGQTTRIYYSLFNESCYVTIKIYNGTDKLVRTLLNYALRAWGPKSVVWDGKGSSGKIVPSGTYIIKIWIVDKAGNRATTYPIIKTVEVL